MSRQVGGNSTEFRSLEARLTQLHGSSHVRVAAVDNSHGCDSQLLVHGFLEQRTIFAGESEPDDHEEHECNLVHMFFLRAQLRLSVEKPDPLDPELVLADRRLRMSPILLCLLFPYLCEVVDEVPSVVMMPDLNWKEWEELLASFFGEQADQEMVTQEMGEETVLSGEEAPLLSCQICREPFNDEYNLLRHEVEAHEDAATQLTGFMTEKMHFLTYTDPQPDGALIKSTKKSQRRRTRRGTENRPPAPPPTPQQQQAACMVCGKRFASLASAVRHEVDECHCLSRGHLLRGGLVRCGQCQKGFGSRGRLQRHEQLAHSRKAKPHLKQVEAEKIVFMKALEQLRELSRDSTTCGHCARELPSVRACREHEIVEHEDYSSVEPVLECVYCERIFTDKQSLNVHLLTHTGRREFVCHLCAKSFKTSCNLTTHLANSHDTAETGLERSKLQCRFCDKSFSYRAQLSQHERVHTKEKPFQCELCDKQFSAKCNLKMHLETHKGPHQRPFKCPHCPHRATSQILLSLHVNTHTGLRPFVCSSCGESYRRPTNLRRHIKAGCKTKHIRQIKVLETLETVIITGDEEDSTQNLLQEEFITGDLEIEQEEELVDDVEGLLEEQVVVEDGVQYEIELEQEEGGGDQH